LRPQNLFPLNMDKPLYWLALALVRLLQALPLRCVARIGRAGGALAYWLDARHRRVALRNLTMCLGREKSPAEIRALARENFRRIGENFACAAKTADMSFEELRPHVQFTGAEKLMPSPSQSQRSLVVAIGHFGNFELYARFGQFATAYQCATTYRALRHPSVTRLMQKLREKSGCLFFERCTEGRELKAAMQRQDIVLGLLADQHAGESGFAVPFLGHDCSTSPAVAVFALRYGCPLFPAICYRVGLAQWRVKVGDEIPTRENGQPRSTEAIMRDVNQAFEAAVRRGPANWFWVHNRWKTTGREPRHAQRSPAKTAALAEGG
jgi:KDO2-lipid IV(A) lauroyltransferase